MRQAVRQAFFNFQKHYEGYMNCMYLDTSKPLGLPTTGIGNLINPVEEALKLPWQRGGGGIGIRPATPNEIRAEWNRVFMLQDYKEYASDFWRDRAALTLTDEAITGLVLSKAESNNAILLKEFPNFEEWPADAQMGAHSMAWAMGAGFTSEYPHWSSWAHQAEVVQGKWAQAAGECHMKDNGSGGSMTRRNHDNWMLFISASNTTRPDVLHLSLLDPLLGNYDSSGLIPSVP